MILGTAFPITNPEDFVHYSNKDENGVYVCQLCSYNNRDLTKMRNHIECKHFPNTFSYNCLDCDKVFGTNNAYLWHKRSHKTV